MTTPEGKVKEKLKKRLKELRCFYMFWPVQTGMGKRTLDCLICAGGWFIAIETKRDGQDLTDLQKEHRREIKAAHGLVFRVSNDAEMEEALKIIEACCMLAEYIRT
jgi:hypothetical protein